MAFAFRVGVYAFFLGIMGYAVLFLGGRINLGPEEPLWQALSIDLLLLMLFAVQHSLMARRGFKTWWTRVVPQSVERSTYVLFASLALALLFWQWRPMPTLVWSVQIPAVIWLLRGLAVVGGLTAVSASLLIDHASLFGLTPAKDLPFTTPGLYKYVRHPIYLGSLLGFWSTPQMTEGHLLFSSFMTAYIFIGVYFEERDLVRTFGTSYEKYQRKVPMIWPLMNSDNR